MIGKIVCAEGTCFDIFLKGFNCAKLIHAFIVIIWRNNMNRKIPPPVFILFLLGFLALEGLSWGGEEQTITLRGKPLTLMGEPYR